MQCFAVKSNDQLSLASQIGQGGEGRIYEVTGRPDVVAKLFKNPTSKVQSKLLAMLNACPSLDPAVVPIVIAWPLDLLLDSNGAFVGYLMRRVSGEKLNIAFAQLRLLEGTSPLTALRVAHNIAAGVGQIHRAGHCIGDLGCFNIISDPLLMCENVGFIDCDSWLVRTGSEVFPWTDMLRPDYRAPELSHGLPQGKQLTPPQDHFSLAVLVFRLLMRGTHPFMGKSRKGCIRDPRETRMEKGLWAYGGAGTREYVPIPNAPRFSELPPELRKLFHTTFVAGHSSPDQRPDACAWAKALEQAEQDGSWLETLEMRRWSPAQRMYAPIIKHGQQASIIGTATAAAICALLAVTQNPRSSNNPIADSAPRVQIDGATESSSTSTPYLWKKLSSIANSDHSLKGSHP